MGKSVAKKKALLPAGKNPSGKNPSGKNSSGKNPSGKNPSGKKKPLLPPGVPIDDTVLDRLYAIVENRRDASPSVSHSARLMSRGIEKVAQKFGEEAIECLIEAVAGNRAALIAESADVLYHLLVMWVASGVRPDQVWEELTRREGVSGITEKASRSPLARRVNTSKIP